jgi:hypothetical protein
VAGSKAKLSLLFDCVTSYNVSMKKRVAKHIDPSVLAKSIVDQFLGIAPHDELLSEETSNITELTKLARSKGGKARAKRLSNET